MKQDTQLEIARLESRVIAAEKRIQELEQRLKIVSEMAHNNRLIHDQAGRSYSTGISFNDAVDRAILDGRES